MQPEKYEIKKIENKISLNNRKQRQQSCLHNQNIYFKRIKTTFFKQRKQNKKKQ